MFDMILIIADINILPLQVQTHSENFENNFLLEKNLQKNSIVILHKSRGRIYIGIIAYSTCFVKLYGSKGQILTIS